MFADCSFGEQVKLLTNVMYDMQRKQGLDLELHPDRFIDLIERQEPRLNGFIQGIVDAVTQPCQTAKRKESKRFSVVAFCHLLAGLRNMFVNNLKLDVGLYLSAAGASVDAIDTMHKMGISVSARTVTEHKKKIVLNHPNEIINHFVTNVNINKYLLLVIIAKTNICLCNRPIAFMSLISMTTMQSMHGVDLTLCQQLQSSILQHALPNRFQHAHLFQLQLMGCQYTTQKI